MLNKKSSTSVKNEVPIGTAISEGEGLYANEIMNTRDAMEREFGDTVKNVNLSLADLGAGALGAYGDNTVYMSKKYASNENMTNAMKVAEESGFHPKIGNKTGVEAVTAHEIGHALGYKASEMAGISQYEIVKNASKEVGIKPNLMAGKISEYARYNYHETIAEAVSDWYCNGNKASKASIAIVKELKKILKK